MSSTGTPAMRHPHFLPYLYKANLEGAQNATKKTYKIWGEKRNGAFHPDLPPVVSDYAVFPTKFIIFHHFTGLFVIDHCKYFM
jgi:hypothetical protein